MSERRWLSAAVVVAVALLAVSAQPAAAANVALVSQRTTASDFSDATLSTATIVRSGDAGAVEAGEFGTTLEGRYPMDLYGNTVYNHVGDMADGTTQAPSVSGIRGQGRDVTDDNIELGTLDQQGDLAVSVWVKPDTHQRSAIVNNYGGTGDSEHFILGTGISQASQDTPMMQIDDGQTDTTVVADTSIPTGEWTHLVGIYDASANEVSILINGRVAGEKSYSGTDPDFGERSIRVGDIRNGFSGYDYQGAVDELRFFRLSSLETSEGNLTKHPTLPTKSGDSPASITTSHDVGQSVSGYADLKLRNATATVTWRESDGTVLDQKTVSSSTNVSGSWSRYPGAPVDLSVEITPSSPDYTARLLSEGVRATNRDPALDESSASPDGTAQGDNTLSINVSDPDFGTAQGEEVTVTFRNASDGTVIGTDTLSSNGTASTTWDGISTGSKEWTAEATDSYGGTSGESQSFVWAIAGELKIYKETQPSELVDDANLTLSVRFFQEGSARVIERETTNGTVDLSGLPADQRFVVTVRANETDQYTYRRIVLDSVIDTSEIYLLNTSTPSSQIIFELDSPTGEFPPDETTLYIEKPIKKNGTTEYRVIAGDRFGSSGSFPVVLRDDARYRLRVETEDGQQRLLGPYTVAGAQREIIRIDNVDIQAEGDAGYAFDAAVEEYDTDLMDGTFIALRYLDRGNATTSLTYEVVRESDSVVVVQNQTFASPSSAQFHELTEENATATLLINWKAERGGETVGGTVRAGQVANIVDDEGGIGDDIDPQLLSLLSWGAIISTMGLLVIIDGKIAGLAGTGVATILTLLGTVAIPLPMLAVAGVISIAALAGRAR